MKKHIIITILLCTNLLFAQTESIDELERRSSHDTGVYYKDTNNVLDDFEGTYVNTNGSTTFKMVLQKMEHSSVNNRYFEDMLIGGYQYIDNGVEKVNTLNQLNITKTDGRNYDIHGNFILTGKTRGCFDCGDNEKWLDATIADPISGTVDELFIRKIVHGGQEAIKVHIYHKLRWRNANDTTPIEPINYPFGEDIILIKQ